MRIAIAGAGLGGLCLAQGLVRAGLDVAVYERDREPATRRQGYRLHVDARAALALQDCLPPELFQLFLATCGRPGRTFTVLNQRLRVLHQVHGDPARDPDDPATLSTSVNRLTLREILLSGLTDRVHFARELVGYRTGPDAVVLSFADGSEATADVLVGADGVQSVVRRQYLPAAEVGDTGARCVYGRTRLDAALLAHVPAPMHEGFTAIVGRRLGLAAGLVRFRNPPPEAAGRIAPYARLSPAEDYLMWAVSAQRERFGVSDERLGELDAAGLHELAQHLIRGWHPDIRELVARADVAETFLVRVRSSTPVPAWPPSRVTLLGDAIHAMSPARGSGANTALQDAALLARQLTGAATDPRAVVAAIAAYEVLMRDYGFAAVLASQQAERTTTRHGVSPALRWLRRPTS